MDSYGILGSSIVDDFDASAKKKQKLTFRLKSGGVEWLILKAPSQQEQKSWVSALKSAMSNKKGEKGRKLLHEALYGEPGAAESKGER